MLTIDYPARVQKVVSALRAASLDALIATRQGTLGYLSGVFLPWRSAVIVTVDGHVGLVTQDIDAGRARAETWITEVSSWSGRPSIVDKIVQFVDQNGLSHGRLGVEMGRPVAPGLLLAVEHAEFLERLPDAALIDAVGVVNPILVAKEPVEIAYLQRATEIAAAGMRAAVAALAAGKTEQAVAGPAEQVMREQGSEWSWSLTGGSEVASGPRTAYPGGVCTPATDRRIGVGELITLDFHAMYRLYLGELSANAILGPCSAPQRKLADAFSATVETLLGALRPGRALRQVSEVAMNVLDRHGCLDRAVPLFGHGLGTCARIPPIVAPWSRESLSPNTVLSLLLQINDPVVGGMRLELPVVVDADGCRPLTDYPYELVSKTV